MNLKNCAEGYIRKIALLESEGMKAKEELQESRAINLSARVLPSVEGIGKTPATSVKQVKSPSGGARKLYSDVLSMSIEKR